jgi:hypothetical protein
MVTLCVQSYAAAATWEGAYRFKAVSDSSRPGLTSPSASSVSSAAAPGRRVTDLGEPSPQRRLIPLAGEVALH